MRVQDDSADGRGECDIGRRQTERPAAYTMVGFGARVGMSKSSIARRIRNGEIRVVKIGRLVRIPASEVERLFG